MRITNETPFERALRNAGRARPALVIMVKPARIIRTASRAETTELEFDAVESGSAWIAEMREGKTP